MTAQHVLAGSGGGSGGAAAGSLSAGGSHVNVAMQAMGTV
jgi:hypothetical protein